MPNEPDRPLLTLSAVEARILGSLMEKELTTPDSYPLTLNSLTLACNQKSNREPVMNLTQGDVGHVLNHLELQRLVQIERGERAMRVSQQLRQVLHLDRKGQAILGMLMLREPLTVNDLRARTQRMVEFTGSAEILAVLERLAQTTPPLVLCLPKGVGQREPRYTHLLCGEPQVDLSGARSSQPAETTIQHDALEMLESRVSALEAQVAVLLDRVGAKRD